MTGAIILQGPHHTAQKSTNTGWSAFKTSCSKLASVASTIACTAMRGSPFVLVPILFIRCAEAMESRKGLLSVQGSVASDFTLAIALALHGARSTLTHSY